MSRDLDAEFGGDFKYGVTANVTADLTVNTDFAQVEVDEQQVNLTRFSLFLPEKRDFFLEGRGNFDFARGGAGGGFSQTGSDTPTLFYSRRIGLNRGRVIPIDVGGRLTGKVGSWGLGAVNIQSGEEEFSRTDSTNFTVLRVKRDILRRSTIGAIFTNRSIGASAALPGRNQAYGVDGAFCVLPERRRRRLLRAHRHRRPGRRQRELPGPRRVGAGSLRRPRRVPEGGRGLQSRDRLPAPDQLREELAVPALQPAAEEHRGGAQVHHSRRRSTTS